MVQKNRWPNEPDIQVLEIERFLKDYLENQIDLMTICDDVVMNYYVIINLSMKGELTIMYVNWLLYF